MKRSFLAFLIVLCLFQPVSGQAEPVVYGVEPTFSHDGRMITYSASEGGKRDIFVVDELGGKRRLTSDVYWDGQPVFSHDDRAIVFVSDRSGNRELWQVDLDGENIVQLTKGVYWKSSPSVSPKGKIAFIAGRHPNSDFYILESGVVKRMTTFEAEVYSPVWSPDEKKIAFVMGEELMVINADGTGLKKIASRVYSRGLSWGVDGRILYLEKNLGYDLWWIDVQDPGNRELIYSGVTDSWEVNPAISSKGEIAFSTDKDGAYRIHVISIQEVLNTKDASSMPVEALSPNLLISENKGDVTQSSLETTEKMTGEETRDETEKRESDEMEIPDRSDNEVTLPKEYEKGIEVPEPPIYDRNEIFLFDDSVSDATYVPDAGYIDFLLLAAIALLALLTIRMQSRRSVTWL